MAKLPHVDMLASQNWFCSARHEIARRNSLSTEDDRYKLPQLAVLVPPAVVAGVRRVLPIAPALTPDAQAHAGQRVATACRDLGAALLALVQALAARQPVACALDGVLDARVHLIVHRPVTSPAAGYVSPPSRGFQTTPDHDTPQASLWRQMADIDLSGLTIDQLAELVGKAQSEMASREKQRCKDLRSEIERRLAEDGYKLGDIFPELGSGAASGRQRRKRPAKSRNPQSPEDTWSGIGRSPKWVQAILAEWGIDMAAFKGIPMYQIHA